MKPINLKRQLDFLKPHLLLDQGFLILTAILTRHFSGGFLAHRFQSHPRPSKSEWTGAGPGLMVMYSQVKWIQRATRQRGCLKKTLTIHWNKPSPLQAAPTLFQATCFIAQVTERHWAPEFHSLYPEGPFLKWQKLMKNSPEFHMCNSWNCVVLVLCFFFSWKHMCPFVSRSHLAPSTQFICPSD